MRGPGLALVRVAPSTPPVGTHRYDYTSTDCKTHEMRYRCVFCGETTRRAQTPGGPYVTDFDEAGSGERGRTCTVEERAAHDKRKLSAARSKRTRDRKKFIAKVTDVALQAIQHGADPDELHKQIDVAVVFSVHDS